MIIVVDTIKQMEEGPANVDELYSMIQQGKK
jgi:hypothetical protein